MRISNNILFTILIFSYSLASFGQSKETQNIFFNHLGWFEVAGVI